MKKHVLVFLSCLGGAAVLCLVLIFLNGALRPPVYKAESGDFPQDFSVRFVYWTDASRKNILDSKEHILQKDLVLDGTAETTYDPDETVLRSIWAGVMNNGFPDIDQKNLKCNGNVGDGTAVSITPLTQYEITIEMNCETYSLHGNSYTFHFQDRHEDAKRFCTVCRFLMNVFENSAEFRSLPNAKSGYQ